MPPAGISATKDAVGARILVSSGALNDSSLDEIEDNSVYTLKFYDGSDNPLETRTYTVPKRPYKESERTDGIFTQVTGIASHNLTDAKIGGTLSFTYAKSADYTPWHIVSYLEYQGVGLDSIDYGDVSLLETSGSLKSHDPAPFVASTADFILSATDALDRKIETHWLFD